MPKGEHFKKDNPRIHQVSFKLNATELAELKAMVAQSGKGLPQFFRDILFNKEQAVSTKVELKAESPKVVETPKEVEAPKAVETPKPSPKPVAQPQKERDELPKHEPRKDNKTNQFSLF